MKKIILLTILLSTSFSTFALELDNSFKAFCYESPKVQKRNGVYYLPNKQEPFTGQNVCVYKSDDWLPQYHSKGYFLNGLRDGKWTWWYESGQKWTEINYINGSLEGKFIWWYKNGQTAEEKEYINGKLEGKVTTWYSNGQIESEETLDGKVTTWYSNGQLESEENWKDGTADGVWTQWFDDGNIFTEHHYKDGFKHGKWTKWRRSGSIYEETIWKNGKCISKSNSYSCY